MKIDELITLKLEDSFFAMVEGDLREFCKEEVYQIAFESLEPHTEEYTVELNTHGIFKSKLPITEAEEDHLITFDDYPVTSLISTNTRNQLISKSLPCRHL